MLDRIIEFVLDMKNILSFGVLVVFMTLALNGTLEIEQSYNIILMTFTFFLGYKVGANKNGL